MTEQQKIDALRGDTASNAQAQLISEYDYGDCAWITLHILRNWGSFRQFAAWRIRTFGGNVAGLHPYHVY